LGAPEAARVGDFIETTSATPLNYQCARPHEDVCDNSQWNTVPSDYQNFLSYSSDGCQRSFQPQQNARGRCEICTTGIINQAINGMAVCNQI
jgi:hypothetical protein